MRKVIMTLAITLMGVAAQAKDIKTVIFTTQPQMHCASCEKKIKGNLRYEKGVKRIDTSVEQQKVTVKYDADKTSAEKLQKAFKKFGYEARQVKANEKVKRDNTQSCSNM
ncbi:heavy metal-associated domain-containing protein [Hallella faecis]|uniref:Heavy metal-associated domain-containing protein n=1 Tax=Hallella faecis TaxID=2841596 RepID=A0ABV1FQ31_9BACT|nr:heavy metal-associated domain-containing protein [Hallella faecis]MBU0289587.1 heavy-metal-associated domain-containing protein [Hallella faecis]